MASKTSISGPESSSLTNSLNIKAEEDDPLSSNYPTWSSRTKCLQAYSCLVMNFSSILRFCFALGEYGSTILIPYAIFRLFYGISIILLEIMLGRYVMGNVAKAWTMCPFANGMLICLALITFAAIVFNYVQLIYLFLYLSTLFRTYLPWETCNPSWARINCYAQGNNASAVSLCLRNHTEEFCNSLSWEPSAKQYWTYIMNETNDLELLFFSLIFVSFAIGLVFTINYRGIRSLEKVLPILVYLPLFLASIVALVTFLIPGTPMGFLEIWFFNYVFLMHPEIWIIGFEDTISSLNIGMLALPLISSHGKFIDDIYTDTLIVVFADLFCCLLAATPLLSVLQAFKSSDDYRGKVKILDNIDVFIWLTEALTKYVYPKVLWSFIFFVEMIIFVLGTQSILFLALCETFLGAFDDPFSFLWTSCLMSLIIFLFVTPFILIPSFDFYPLESSIATIVFLGLITIEIFYGKKKFCDDFHFMMGDPPSFLLSSLWIGAIIITAVLIILKVIFLIPRLPFEHVVYVYTGIPILIYIIAGIRQFYNAQQNGRILEAFVANPNWGPSNPILKESRIVFNSQAVTKEFMYRQELNKKPFTKPENFSNQNIVQII